jgi:hypothetical protein
VIGDCVSFCIQRRAVTHACDCVSRRTSTVPMSTVLYPYTCDGLMVLVVDGSSSSNNPNNHVVVAAEATESLSPL